MRAALAHDEAVAVLVKGRLARAGSSLRVDRALAALNPATAVGVMQDSTPPQSMASARPMTMSV
jgi:hypothetical protein